MSTRKLLPGLLLLVVVLAACSFTTNNDSTDEAVVATAVEAQLRTQAAAEQEDQDDDQDPEPDPEDIPDQPVLYPGAGACREMVGWMDQYFGVQPEITSVNFGEAESGVAGEGCQVMFSATGEEMTDWGSRTADLVNSIFAGGWMEDLNFSAGGAGGLYFVVRRDTFACSYLAEVGPEDSSLCSSNEPLTVCLDRLDPAYIQYELTIGCTVDKYVPPPPEPTPEEEQESAIRISFEPGDIMTYVNGTLDASSSQRYVLWAMEGQELVVRLNPAPPLQAIVVIYGEDGTVLISDHATTAFWSGILPSTQDYYISVRSSPDYPISYFMQVIIPPVGELYTDTYIPMAFDSCLELAGQVNSAMGVEAMTDFGLFYDYLSSNAGIGCKITAWGTLDQFPDRTAMTTTLFDTLEVNGWGQAHEYDAGGAGGFATAYSRGNNLCLYTEMINEMNPWVCDAYEGPISVCWNALEDSEMFFSMEFICSTWN